MKKDTNKYHNIQLTCFMIITKNYTTVIYLHSKKHELQCSIMKQVNAIKSNKMHKQQKGQIWRFCRAQFILTILSKSHLKTKICKFNIQNIEQIPWHHIMEKIRGHDSFGRRKSGNQFGYCRYYRECLYYSEYKYYRQYIGYRDYR